MKAAEQKKVEASVAHAAVSKRGQRTFAAIRAEIERNGGGKVRITTEAMTALLGIGSTTSIAASVRELEALGLVTVEAGYRGGKLFALAETWRGVTDPAAAAITADVARKNVTLRTYRAPGSRVERNRRKVVEIAEPVEPDAVDTVEPERQGPRPISLFKLDWPRNERAGLRPGEVV